MSGAVICHCGMITGTHLGAGFYVLRGESDGFGV